MIRRVLILLLGAAAVLAPAAAAPGGALAGTYTVHSCRAPDGSPASTDGWSWSAFVPSLVGYAVACPDGGITLRLLPGQVQDTDQSAFMRFTAPAATEVVRYRVWRSTRLSQAARYYYSATEALPGGREAWVLTPCGGGANTCTAVGDPARPLDDVNLIDRRPPTPVSRYGAYISCGLTRPEQGDCAATTPIAVETTVWRAESELLDDDWPVFPATPTGSLLEGGTLSGVKRVSTYATDRGGGVAATAVEIDGSVVAQQTFSDEAGTCRQPYTVRVPCPTGAGGSFSFDTSTLGDGAHRVRVLATDAAGNTSAWGPVEITTDNSAVMCTPAPTPPNAGVALSTSIVAESAPNAPSGRRGRGGKGDRGRRGGRGRGRKRGRKANATAAVTVPIGRGAIVSGRLTDATGAPVAGAPVCISTRVGDGGGLMRLARVATDGDGRYSANVPAGTSRQVWSVHRVGGGTVNAKATLNVRGEVTLRPKRKRLRTGRTLVMRGRLAGRPIPSGGVLVNVQARRGRTWQTFRSVRSDARGRFTVRYRFVGGRGRYALRAALPRQSTYPFTAATSKPFTVRVTARR